MSTSTKVKNFLRYRTLGSAVINAGVTWTILIIAPLGLFAVLTCTALVFLSNLGIGTLSDRALLYLLAESDSRSTALQSDLDMPSTRNLLPRDRQPPS